MNSVDVAAGDIVKTTQYNNLRADRAFVGIIIPYSGASAPSYWLLCDGSAVSRVTYSDLFGIIGETFGAGDGVNTFNLPDMRDNTAVGVSGTKAIGSIGGAATVTLDLTTIPAHTHVIANQAAHTHEVYYAASPSGSEQGLMIKTNGTSVANFYLDYDANHDHGGTTAYEGGEVSPSAFSTLPAYVAVNFIIKY